MSANTVNAQLHDAQATIKDPGASGTIVVDKSMAICNIVTLTAESRTLSRPTKAGVLFSLHHQTDGGDCTVTVTGGFNETGSTTITLSDPGQLVVLQSVLVSAGTYAWRVLSNGSSLALTPQLTTITIADTNASPDYALQALTTSTPYGLATQAEAISLLYVIQNLQVRLAEVELRLKAAGVVA